MTVMISGKRYFRTADVCQAVGISKATLFRWLKSGTLNHPVHRDRRGWRLFTEEDVNQLESEANLITSQDTLEKLMAHK